MNDEFNEDATGIYGILRRNGADEDGSGNSIPPVAPPPDPNQAGPSVGAQPSYHERPWQFSPAVPMKRRRRSLFIGLGSVIGILALGFGVWAAVSSARPSFAAIADTCENRLQYSELVTITGGADYLVNNDEESEEFLQRVLRLITVSDDSSSLSIDDRTYGSIDKVDFLSGLTGSARDRAESRIDSWNGARDLALVGVISCVHEELDIPDSVENRMYSTRALDGSQTVTHSGVDITWSYHPSRGIDVIYER